MGHYSFNSNNNNKLCFISYTVYLEVIPIMNVQPIKHTSTLGKSLILLNLLFQVNVHIIVLFTCVVLFSVTQQQGKSPFI